MLFLGVPVLLLIILVIVSSFETKRRGENFRLVLTAEHQRLQRENPEHPDAQMGLEELMVARLGEAKLSVQRHRKIMLRYGGIGALVAFVIAIIIDQIMYLGGSFSFFSFGLAFFGFALGAVVGGVVSLVKHGRPKLRTTSV